MPSNIHAPYLEGIDEIITKQTLNTESNQPNVDQEATNFESGLDDGSN